MSLPEFVAAGLGGGLVARVVWDGVVAMLAMFFDLVRQI